MQAQELFGVNICTTLGLLTATGAETVYDTTVVITYSVNGKGYTKAAVTNGATPTTDGNTGSAFTTLAASEGCSLTWALDASGTVTVYQGSVETLDSDNNFVIAPSFAGLPDTVTAFAYQVLKNSSAGSTVTIGTSNWNATGFTNVIQDVLTMPNRPQEA